MEQVMQAFHSTYCADSEVASLDRGQKLSLLRRLRATLQRLRAQLQQAEADQAAQVHSFPSL